jgi:CDP-diacylglycerol---serine O-phosphatidyltransferase
MRKRLNIRISRSVIPNFFTVLNIFAGFMCVVYAVQNMYLLAAWYIVLAAICDTLDGFMARLTRSSSEFGVELDSLADVVSFGMAPSFLVYMIALREYGPAGILISAIPLIFGALRLARFNVQLVGFTKHHFVGLPIPMSAMMIISFVFFFSPGPILHDRVLHYSLMGLVVVCGLLMVSTIKYPVIPKISLQTVKQAPIQSLIVIAGVLVVIISLGKLLFPVLSILVLSGIARSVWGFYKSLFTQSEAEAPTDVQENQTNPYPLDTR